MDAVHRTFSDRQGETQPLMRSMASRSVGSLCFITMLAGLAVLWCIVDQWNRTVSDTLFDIGNVRMASLDADAAEKGMLAVSTFKPFPSFGYPLFLAFVQFAFMGLLFLAVFWIIFRDSAFSWAEVNLSIFSDRRWPALVVTHVFGIFWLQALMMPTQALSLGLFAATRAMEIPTTAFLRSPIVGAQLGPKTAQTAFLACAAAAILYFAYSQVAGCLCVWSGHGVTLFGLPFWIVYILLLLLPASNVVLQEGVLQKPGMHPLLMLGLMNLFACLLFVPILLFAHMAGWEDVSEAFAMTFRFQEVSMLITWLALQMALISVITVGVILMTDSFWAVALRALRVVYWWVQQLWMFYAGAAIAGQNISMSTACPHASKWSFVMLCGFALAAAAICADRKAEDATTVQADAKATQSTGNAKQPADP